MRGSRIRDHLANERTLLSWVRLGLSVTGLGFVVARFGLFLRELAEPGRPHSPQLTQWIGILMILFGPGLVMAASLRFFEIEREIDAGRYVRRYGVIATVIAASILLGLLLAGYMFLSLH